MSKVIFMGTPDFAVPSLLSLIATQEVVGVVTQPDRPAGRGRKLQPSPVKQVAMDAGIAVYQPDSLRPEAAIEPLRDWQPEAIIVAAFGQILRPHVLELPPKGCINVHASLLPRWRGASPIQHAILAGDSHSGITLMQMDKGLDTGPIYVQEAIPLTAVETSASLHDRLAKLGARMLENHLDDILSGRLPAAPQDDEQATYAPLIKKAAGQIDWQQDAWAIDRHIRAMTPWPGAFSTVDGQQLKILKAHPQQGTLSSVPGQIGEFGETIAVQTGSGLLILDQVQLAGKNPVSAMAFVRGRPHFIGGQLGTTAES